VPRLHLHRNSASAPAAAPAPAPAPAALAAPAPAPGAAPYAHIILSYPYFDYWTAFKYNRDVEIPVLGPIPVLGSKLFFGYKTQGDFLLPGCALGPLSLAVVILWVVTKSWILNDILAISLVVFFLTSVRVSSLKVGTALMTGEWSCYEVTWCCVLCNWVGLCSSNMILETTFSSSWHNWINTGF
jgi:hypothetical protein